LQIDAGQTLIDSDIGRGVLLSLGELTTRRWWHWLMLMTFGQYGLGDNELGIYVAGSEKAEVSDPYEAFGQDVQH
jgi:hypothetical protein